jgi:hypothetical protein
MFPRRLVEPLGGQFRSSAIESREFARDVLSALTVDR